MERPALFVGDAEEGAPTLKESEVRARMKQGIPPESAEEYLLRVRIESSDLPAVVEAHVPEELKKKQTLYMPFAEPVPEGPADLLPGEDWEREVLSTFVDLRQYLRRWKATAAISSSERIPVPALKDGAGWHIFCLGYAEDEEEEEDKAEEEEEDEEEEEKFDDGQRAGLAKIAEPLRDPRNDDDAQSAYCVTPVESSSRFDKFTATLARTAEEVVTRPQAPRDPAAAAGTAAAPARTPTTSSTSSKTTAPTSAATTSPSSLPGASAAAGKGEAGGQAAAGAGAAATIGGGEEEGAPSAAGKRPMGREWLQTHPHGTPPTMRLAMQFDQVLTQRVLAFHADWLRDNLLSRARAVWMYTLFACLEKPLGSETAALVREILRRCCAQRAEVESPLDDNLPALNIIITISGRFFEQAESAS